MRDGLVPDAHPADMRVVDAQTADGSAPDGAAPDATTPDAATPDAADLGLEPSGGGCLFSSVTDGPGGGLPLAAGVLFLLAWRRRG